MLQITSHNFQYQTCSYYACFSFSLSFFNFKEKFQKKAIFAHLRRLTM